MTKETRAHEVMFHTEPVPEDHRAKGIVFLQEDNISIPAVIDVTLSSSRKHDGRIENNYSKFRKYEELFSYKNWYLM